MTTPKESTSLRLSRLNQAAPTEFELQPETAERVILAAQLELLELRKLRFTGQLAPAGKGDWVLTGALGATVVQPCTVTLAPVTTRIDETVTRRYSADFAFPEESEAEMPEDDTLEPLPEVLEIAEVMAEALSLALPPFPRAEGVDPAEARVAPPGVAPLSDDDLKPFAGLAALRDKLGKSGGDES